MLDTTFKISNIIINAYNESHENSNLINVTSYRNCMLETATFFKLSSIYNCDIAIDTLAIDNIKNEYRFTVIYILQSSLFNYSLWITTKTKDGLALLSLQNIYPAFNWAEREIWDLSGIFFTKHPDLRRILTDYGFSGHPLRKDFPISGFREAHYSDLIKQITYSDIELSQSYRLIGISSIWSNNA